MSRGAPTLAPPPAMRAMVLLLACMLASCRVGTHRDGRYLPAISGLTALGPGCWLTVHDGRLPTEARFGTVMLDGARRPAYRELAADALPVASDRLIDIEAAAAVPGRNGEFLVLESGARLPGATGRRRLVHAAVVAGATHIDLRGTCDVLPSTTILNNCEAMLCWQHGDSLRLLIADRGQGSSSANYVAGALELTPECTFRAEPGASGSLAGTLTGDRARACADLLLAADDTIWSTSTVDPGTAGPFRSVISRVGRLDRTSGWPVFHAPEPIHHLDGFKVEGLAQDAAGRIWIAVDDEDFGGALRPLPPAN